MTSLEMEGIEEGIEAGERGLESFCTNTFGWFRASAL